MEVLISAVKLIVSMVLISVVDCEKTFIVLCTYLYSALLHIYRQCLLERQIICSLRTTMFALVVVMTSVVRYNGSRDCTCSVRALSGITVFY